MKKIIVKVGGKKHNLPQGLMKIKYQQGKRIMQAFQLDLEEDYYLKQLYLIAAVLNIKTKEIAAADPIKIATLYQICMVILNQCNIPLYNMVQSNGKWYKMKDLNKLTVDDYFQIDRCYKESPDDILTAGVNIIDQLYVSVKISKLFKIKNFNKQLVSTTANFKINPDDETKINSDELPTGFITSIYNYIIEYKKNIMIKYPIIFEQQPAEEDEQEEDETKKFGYQQSIAEIWGWYDIISSTCNNNKLEIDYWMTRPCEEFLTFMCYQVQKNKAEQKQQLK